MPLRVRLTKVLAHLAKFRMNMRHMLIMPRNAWISETSLHGPHLEILSMYLGSGSRLSRVQRCPTAMISSAHRTDFGPLKVPLQYLTCCTTQLRLWNCSQTKYQMPGLSGMHSLVLSSRIYLVSSPWIGTSSMYSMVVLGISGCRMRVMS